MGYIAYLPHPLYPPLYDMDIYSYHEGEVEVLKRRSPFKLSLINELSNNLCYNSHKSLKGKCQTFLI